jgi:hypothetical protein
MDKRPRFGWANSLDNDPQIIAEKKLRNDYFPVAVIPLAFMSAKMRDKVRKLAKEYLNPE